MLLYFSITEQNLKQEFLDLMANLLNLLLTVHFPISISEGGTHFCHALGSVHV